MTFSIEDLQLSVIEGYATWWEMDLPSKAVRFGEAKPQMIGREPQEFKTYEDFTALLHPDDHEKAMQAMREHLQGEKELYETTYRIKHKDGHYLTFYDCGHITKKTGDDITITGFVMSISEEVDIKEQMQTFKESLIEGKPSIIQIITQMKETRRNT